MDLSLHMIANRIYTLDLETNISDKDLPVLKSARGVSSTNCVRVVSSGNDTLCLADSGYIRLKDMKLSEGFDIIQAVFDFYDEWYQRIKELLERGRYQEFIDLCYFVFHNPAVLLDSSAKVLGISSQFPADSFFDEWGNMQKTRTVSIGSINKLNRQYKPPYFEKNYVMPFQVTRNGMKINALTRAIIRGNDYVIRMNVFEKERSLNLGDRQILDIIFSILQDIIDTKNTTVTGYADFVNKKLFEQAVEENELKGFLTRAGWAEDDLYQAAVLHPLDKNCFSTVSYNLLLDTLMNEFNNVRITIKNGDFVFLQNITKNCVIDEGLLPLIFKETSYRLGFSLTVKGLQDARFLYKQALYVISKEEKGSLHFRDFAVSYLIEAPSLDERVHAVSPEIFEIYRQSRLRHDGMFETVLSYLRNYPSLNDTANEQFLHKNTIFYRVNKLKFDYSLDFENASERLYLLLSAVTLSIYDERAEAEKKKMATPDKNEKTLTLGK